MCRQKNGICCFRTPPPSWLRLFWEATAQHEWRKFGTPITPAELEATLVDSVRAIVPQCERLIGIIERIVPTSRDGAN
jgi:hypothetical protein